MLHRMQVGTRVIAGFLLVTLVGAIVAAIGIGAMARINADTERLYQKELVAISHIKEANIYMVEIGRSMRNVFLASSEQNRKAWLAAIENQAAEMEGNLDKARQLFYTERGQRMFAEMDASRRK